MSESGSLGKPVGGGLVALSPPNPVQVQDWCVSGWGEHRMSRGLISAAVSGISPGSVGGVSSGVVGGGGRVSVGSRCAAVVTVQMTRAVLVSARWRIRAVSRRTWLWSRPN